jgi:hypothetical protein
MLLATSNAQGELSALERGLHALRSGMDVRAYADSVGRKRATVQNEISAARVVEACPDIGTEATEHFSHLVEIHAAPSWLWPALVEGMLDNGCLTPGSYARPADAAIEASGEAAGAAGGSGLAAPATAAAGCGIVTLFA